jgi:flavin-dependent dehydrogenase
MIGDSAGLITPLCGNGMAMAIHAAYLLSNLLGKYFAGQMSRLELEQNYQVAWKAHFQARLKFGYNVQKIFGKQKISSIALKSLQVAPFMLPALVKRTHGSDFFNE